MRKITRRYFSKKEGKYITKTYEYGKASTKSLKQFIKQKSNVSIKLSDYSYGQIKSAFKGQEGELLVREYYATTDKNRKISMHYLLNYIATGVYKNVKALYNTGVDVEQLCENLNITMAYLDNETHWTKDGDLILEDGELVQIKWDYNNGSVLTYRGEIIS